MSLKIRLGMSAGIKTGGIGVIGGGGVAQSSLLTGLVAYWKFNESSDGSASVQRADSVGTNHLSDNGTIASAAGKLSNAGHLVSADDTYFSIGDDAALSPGGNDFEMVFWFKLNADATMRIFCKDDGITHREWGVQYSTASKKLLWFAFFSGVAKVVTANTFGVLSQSTWYMADIYFDPTNQKIGIAINDGAFDLTDTASATLTPTDAPFEIGRLFSGGLAAEECDCDIDEVGIWMGRLLTADERTELYNGGAGKTHPFDGTNPATVIPSAYRDLYLTRYASNPIVALGAADSWEDTDVANPDVFWDTPNERWVMNYSGYDGAQWHTGIAYSDDLLTWTKEATNPVLSPVEGEGYIAANGSIVLKGSTYYLFYQGAVGLNPAIFLATSANLVDWTRANGGTAILPGGYDPAARLMPDGTTIELFYCHNVSDKRTMGRATTTNGIALTDQGDSIDQDDGYIGEQYPLFDTGQTYCVTCDNNGRVIAKYVTNDGGATWKSQGTLLPGSGGENWDSTQTFDSCAFVSGNTLYLFYAGAAVAGGSEGYGIQIGVATSPFGA